LFIDLRSSNRGHCFFLKRRHSQEGKYRVIRIALESSSRSL
jgi:hypothetical protein